MEAMAAFEVAGALISTLKGIFALYTLVEKYAKSASEMLRFLSDVESLERRLRAIRKDRIRLRQSGENTALLHSVMESEKNVWKTLIDIDDDILCSLHVDGKHWEKVSRTQKAKWTTSVSNEAAKFHGRLFACVETLNKCQIDFMHHDYTRKRLDKLEARLPTGNNVSQAMGEALVQDCSREGQEPAQTASLVGARDR